MECESVVIAPGMLLAMATYEGNDSCISVGLTMGMGVTSSTLSLGTITVVVLSVTLVTKYGTGSGGTVWFVSRNL